MADPKLYIIATPLGNRDDITLRALNELKRLDTFFAEDSREFFKLLELYGIPTSGKRVHSYASHNLKEATELALALLREGREVGVVSDRGTPCISDPGALLARRALDEGIGVTPIPGPSSVTSVLSVCGFPAERFLFVGFLPHPQGERHEVLASFRGSSYPVVFFESPKRIRRTAEELKALYPERRLFLGREMTKHFETFQSFRLAELDPSALMEKGEYAVVLEGAAPTETVASDVGARVESAIAERLGPDKAWAKRVAADLGLSATEVYNALQRAKTNRL